MQTPDTDDSNTPSDEEPVISLQDAVDQEDVAAVKAFLANDLSLAHQELESGFTPWENTKLSSEDMIDAFIDAGVNVDWQDGQGRTLAHFCAEDGVIETLTHLVSRGANLQITDNEDLGLLDYAARGQKVETTGFLLGQGCTWDQNMLKQVPENDTTGTRDLLLADLARIEANKAIAELDTTQSPKP